MEIAKDRLGPIVSNRRVVRIDDPDDVRIEPYRAVRERDLCGRDGGFIAEGEVVVRTLLSGRSRFAAQSLLLADNRLERLAPMIEACTTAPVYAATRAVLDRIVGFPIHRGVLAAGRRGLSVDPAAALQALPPDALVVGLFGLANHDNVGAVFRNAAAFGADLVLLDDTCCDPLYRKSIRVSVGACLTVPFARGGSAGANVDLLVASGFDVSALSPVGRGSIETARWEARTALLLGAEGAGLPREILARVSSLRIGMTPGFDSLNVGTAAGIALHAAHAARRSRSGRRDDAD